MKKVIIFAVAMAMLSASPVSAQKKPAAQATGTLKIKAGVVMRSGDVKWVAKKNFMVLIQSLRKIQNTYMSELNIEPHEHTSFCGGMMGLLEKTDVELKISESVVDNGLKASISVCSTDFSGECQVKLPAGRYYVSPVNDVEIGSSTINWDVPVEIKPSQTTYIELSNDNSFSLRPVWDNYLELKSTCRSF